MIGEDVYFDYNNGEIVGCFNVQSVLPKKIIVKYKDELYPVDKCTILRNRLNALLYKEIHKQTYSTDVEKDIDLREAPLCPNGVSWKDCVGMSFDFHYYEYSGKIKILNYDAKTRKATIFIDQITGKDGYDIIVNDLQNCNLHNCIITSKNTIKNKRRDLMQYLVNPDDEKLCIHSNRYIECKCPICDSNKKISVNVLSTHGLRCQKCKDNISYPEKFFMSLLDQLKIKYIYQLSKKNFDWCGKYIYDFYIPSKECIIEINGAQHYNGNFKSLGGRDLTEEQLNDTNKEINAKENNVKHYISIDCRNSNLEWIKKSVLASELPALFNFFEEDINWDECSKNAVKNLVVEVCNYYNDNLETIADIAKHFKLSCATITKYLKLGNEIGLCKYNSQFTRGNSRYPIEVFKNNILLGVYPSKKYVIDNSFKLFGEHFTMHSLNAVLNKEKSEYKGYYFSRKMEVNINGK